MRLLKHFVLKTLCSQTKQLRSLVRSLLQRHNWVERLGFTIWVRDSVSFYRKITTKALWEIAKFVHSLTIIWFSNIVDNIAYRKLQRKKNQTTSPCFFRKSRKEKEIIGHFLLAAQNYKKVFISAWKWEAQELNA